MKKISVIRDTYGIDQYPVIVLNYHNGEENLLFYPKNNMVDIELLNKIGKAIQDGYKVEYIDNPTIGDLK